MARFFFLATAIVTMLTPHTFMSSLASAETIVDDAPPNVDALAAAQRIRGGKGKGKGGGKGGRGSCQGKGCKKACSNPTFILNPEELSWSEHEAIARERDCHLASIHSDTEQQDAFAAAATGQSKGGRVDAWIGGTPPCGLDVSTNPNEWVWSDGTCMDYFNWVNGEPSGAAGDPNGALCLEMDGDRADMKMWNDDECFKDQPAVYRCCDSKGKGGSKGGGFDD